MYINILKLKKVILSISLIVCVNFNVYAADISAIDFNGDLLGKVIPDGGVINFNNELVGHITADGYIVDDNNMLIGGIVPQGIAISNTNKILGKVNNDGTVTEELDNLVGKVLPQGLVVDDSYNVLGAVISSGLVYNDKGKIVGRVSGNGYFYDLAGENSGVVTATGFVYGLNKDKYELLGKLISSKVVNSFDGKVLGSITPDGKVTNLKKEVLGNIHANGYVYNKDNTIVGYMPSGGYAFDYSGKYLGVISYNGEVLNNGTTVAYTINNNRVVDKAGNIIGFTLNFASTLNTIDGRFLGYLIPDGKIARGKEIIGKINATGEAIDDNGVIIGFINKEGPVFDYLGRLKGNASISGIVTTLDGNEQGYMLKEKAFDFDSKEIGRLLAPKVVFDKNNQFIGINGINNIIYHGAKEYTISPYGYLFDKDNKISGSNIALSGIYTPEGNLLSYTSVNGDSEDVSLNEIAKLEGNGVFIDKNNKILGSINNVSYVTDFLGKSIGNIGYTNLITNDKNERIAKILPNSSIMDNNGTILTNELAGNLSVGVSINGDYIGTNTINGIVVKDKQVIGKITSNRYIIDSFGALNGGGIPYSVVVAKDCKFLGVISSNGDIRAPNNSYLGMMLTNGQAVNEEGEVIGQYIIPSVVIGENGDVIGSQTILGNVLNYQNENLGCQSIDGFVRNAQNEIIGTKVEFWPVMNFDSKKIGYTDLQGKIVDDRGIQIASMDLSGNILSKNNDYLGVLFKYTVAFDSNNVYMGRVDTNGNVISDSGNIIGYVKYDGEVVFGDKVGGYALYDLYVYDNDEKTIGYIAKNGRVYSILGDAIGSIYNGFVLDKKKNVIARGKRDYFIRNKENKSIGYLKLDGNVINTKNVNIGNLNNQGDVINKNEELVAKAHYLQYYLPPMSPEKNDINVDKENIGGIQEVIDGYISNINEAKDENQSTINSDDIKKDINISSEDTNTIPSEEAVSEGKTVDNNSKQGEGAIKGDTTLDISDKKENTKQIKESKEATNTKLNHKIIGIAITPGGKYIGDVYDNQKVIGESGEIIGTLDENGEIIDKKGNTVGSFKKQEIERKNISTSKNWWPLASGATISPYNSNDNITNVGPGGGVGPGGRYNPRRAAILSQLHQERRQSLSGVGIKSGYNAESYTGWQDDWGIAKQISSLRVDMSNMITADKPIPAVLARSLVSIGDTPVTAIVERNIYGDAGRNVIIPAGSRIIGGLQSVSEGSRYDSTSGGVKIDISWSRIIRPDGISFMLGSAQTGDAQGRGGGALGYVDEQLVKKYTLPIVGTMVTSAITYMMAADEESTGEIENSKQEAASDARQQFMERMDEILQEIIDSKKQIEPVTYVPAGTRVIIYPMVDLWLRTTKDIDKGATSVAANVENVLVTSDGSGDGANGGATQGGQIVTTAGGGNKDNEQPQNQPLVADSGNTNNQQQRPMRALPPPSADGSEMTVSENNENESDGEGEGEIVLF
ncbi:MAG: TrbI/VirB10 family protein [Alphaproteobacteria bacterium]|nr:TrbI/VirB10 family protein [Alphaproteobacteria bacterium]